MIEFKAGDRVSVNTSFGATDDMSRDFSIHRGERGTIISAHTYLPACTDYKVQLDNGHDPVLFSVIYIDHISPLEQLAECGE